MHESKEGGQEKMSRKNQREQITSVLPHDPLVNPLPPGNKPKRLWETRPFKWTLGIAAIVFTTIFGVEVTNTWNLRCFTFPIAYELVRQQTCSAAVPATTEQFLIVLGGLAFEDAAGNRAENLEETTPFSMALYQGLSTPFPSELDVGLRSYGDPSYGDPNDEDPYYVDPWVDRISVGTDLEDYAERMAIRFDARLIIYGTVVKNGQNSDYRPCIYVRRSSVGIDLSIVNDESITCEIGSIPFLENGDSDTLRNWIQALRQLTIGLQQLQEARASDENTLRSFEDAIRSFELVSTNPIPGLAALGHIYAGNAALDSAIRLQVFDASDNDDDDDCVAGRCQRYNPQIEQFYRRSWDHYTTVLALQTESDQAFYRALIGRGNVHYRLAQLTRLATDTGDNPQDISIQYNCSHESLLLTTNESGVGETLDWYERSYAAMECYEQAARIAPDDDAQQIKIAFGLAQTQQWLGREVDDSALLSASVESYENAIEQFQQLYPQEEDGPRELRCLTGAAYGERARVRWQNALLQQIVLPSVVRADLEEAVQILGDEANTCQMDNELSGYRLDLQSIP